MLSCNICLTIDLRNNITGEPLVNSTDKVGCDYHKQSWCLDQLKMYLIQYIVGLYILTPGYCASSLICYTMFSKILGPRPQVLLCIKLQLYTIHSYEYISMCISVYMYIGTFILKETE